MKDRDKIKLWTELVILLITGVYVLLLWLIKDIVILHVMYW